MKLLFFTLLLVFLVIYIEACPWYKIKCGHHCCAFGSYCINKKTGECCYGICSTQLNTTKGTTSEDNIILPQQGQGGNLKPKEVNKIKLFNKN